MTESLLSSPFVTSLMPRTLPFSLQVASGVVSLTASFGPPYRIPSTHVRGLHVVSDTDWLLNAPGAGYFLVRVARPFFVASLKSCFVEQSRFYRYLLGGRVSDLAEVYSSVSEEHGPIDSACSLY